MTTAVFTEDDLREMVLRLAHEIRNPLATIKSAAQLLEHLQPPDDELADYYTSIYAEVTRIDSVIRDLQRYARLDVQTARAVSVDDVVATAVDGVTASDRAAVGRVEVVGGPATQVLIDPTQLEIALAEILKNALRLSEDAAPVGVSWEHRDHSLVAIAVDDSGPGVSDKVREKMFRPFFSTSTQGTGLGLNIVAKTCELAGGSLTFENLQPTGARFTLVIPRV